MKTNTLIRVLQASFVAVLIAGVAFAGNNTLNVVSPGLGGTNFKLRLDFANDNNQLWVQADDPGCEETINIEWMHTTPGLIFDADDRIDSMLLRSEPTDPGGAANWIRCRTQVGNGSSTNNVRCSYQREDGKFQYIGTAGFNPNFEHTWRIEILRASAPAAADGNLKFYKNGGLVFERQNAINFNACYSRIRMGTGGPLNGTTDLSGPADFDEFVATR